MGPHTRVRANRWKDLDRIGPQCARRVRMEEGHRESNFLQQEDDEERSEHHLTVSGLIMEKLSAEGPARTPDHALADALWSCDLPGGFRTTRSMRECRSLT